MNCIIFEDQYVESNYPATLSRPAFAITCGVTNLYETARLLGCRIRTVLREYLTETAARQFPSAESADGPTLYLNAALVPDVRIVRKLLAMAEEGAAFLVPSGRRAAAAFLPDGPALAQGARPETVSPFLLEQKPPLREAEMPTIDYPFDLVRYHNQIFQANLAGRLEGGGYRRLSEGVHVGEGVKIANTAVLHPEEGPIVLEDNVTVMDFAYLSGPLYVGPNSRIIERSSVKENPAIGHACKIGGEVEESVIEAYTNKQHHGFLGHTYVGSWVNLGAGTSNSDLKNTYGTVRMDVRGERVETGMQFLGCIIGDFSKSAINTSIFTGKIVGVSSMLYGFVTTNVPSFCNYARSFGQVTEVSVDTAIETQKRMFVRREVEQTPEDIALLHAMYDRTRNERIMAAGPLSL